MRVHHLGIHNNSGFTLIEVIITLIVASILGSMMVKVMGANLTGSVQPLIRTQNALTINEVMENITADYKRLMVNASSATPLKTLKGNIAIGMYSTNTPYYGEYSIITNNYIIFSNNAEAAFTGSESDARILKVTIAQNDQKLTALFTQ